MLESSDSPRRGDTNAAGVSEHLLDYHACWAGVFQQGDYEDWEQIDTIFFRDANGKIDEEASLGLLELRHPEAMIALARANREHVRVGTADEQLRTLTAIRDACRENPNLRAAYHVDF